MLLAWDTSTDVVTVAAHDGRRVVAHRRGAGTRRHAEVLSPLVADVLDEIGLAGSDLDGIAVGVGPGAYTGLRVGLVTAQALGLTWAVPVRGACSLDAVAVQAVTENPLRFAAGVVVVADARRQQVFWSRYTSAAARVSGPSVGAPDSVERRGSPTVGAGAAAHRDLFLDATEPSLPDAGWLATGLLDGRILEQSVQPLYLRAPDVTPAAGPKSVLQPGTVRHR